ncbi:hypothetical protein E2C01_038150 [Portunus trituberculatus]|uniref:Uncharacterized protein n=1 Tax=Portunus trituberculatus TaxID=210409 RepID=A0A5B7FG26_PORTR|nr:hypothetical protein [Portunus trituberculatus]
MEQFGRSGRHRYAASPCKKCGTHTSAAPQPRPGDVLVRHRRMCFSKSFGQRHRVYRQPGVPSWPRSAIQCTPVAPRCVSRLKSSREQVLGSHRAAPPVACVGPVRLPSDGVKDTHKLTLTLDFCRCLRTLGASRWDVIRPCADSKCSTFASHLLHARTHLSALGTHGASENTSPPR